MSTRERSQAYGRVVQTLRDLGPSRLLPAEEDLIRETADTLLFGGEDDAAGEAVSTIETVAAHLVESERMTPESAARLVDDVLACGRLEVARASA
jgi:hypothetical protein